MSKTIPLLSVANYTLSPHTFEQAEACPRARVYRGPKRETGHAQWHGIGLHLFLQYAAERGRDYAIGYVKRKFPRMVPFLSEIDLSVLPQNAHAEPQFILDTQRRESVLVEKGEARGLADPRTHLTVRGDLLAEKDGLPWVIDYKSGKGNATHPSTSIQSALEAASAYALDQKKQAVLASVFNIARKAAGEPTMIEQRHHTFAPRELERVLDRARRVHLLVLETRAELRDEGIEPEPLPGAWCRYCHASNACDAAQIPA